MKKSSALAAILLIASTALAGCSAPDAPTDDASTQQQDGQVQSESSQEATAEDDAQDWADSKIRQWHEVEGADDFSRYYDPFNNIQSWHAGDEGEVVLVVDPSITASDKIYLEDLGPANDLWLIAAVMLEQIDAEAPDLHAVTAITSDGSRTETFTREYMEQVREQEQDPRP